MRILAFLLCSVITAAAHDSSGPPSKKFEHIDGSVLGSGDHRYKLNANWAKVTPEQAPVINSHAMIEGADGLLYLVTDHPKNAFLVFQKDGTFVRSFGEGLVGGHGIDVIMLDGEEHLIHVDCGWHFEAEGWKSHPSNGRISIVKKDGTVVTKFPTPFEMGIGKPGAKQFMPCDVAVTPQNTILVVDGYASDRIFEMTPTGELIRRWGGRTKDESTLKNAHGISIEINEGEDPVVWVSSRDETKIKAFTLMGKHLPEKTIELPGAYAGQLCIKGDKMYTAVCWSKKDGTGRKGHGSGFVMVLDRKTKEVIASLGGTSDAPYHQTEKVFVHGHDLCVDDAGNIYVGEWNANRRYPFVLSPVE